MQWIGVHAVVIILMFSSLLYSIKSSWVTSSNIELTNSQTISRLWKAKKIRNGIVLVGFLFLIFLCDIVRLTYGSSRSIRIAATVLNSLVGPSLLVLEGFLYDPNFRRPFRWQRQRWERMEKKKQNLRNELKLVNL